MFFIGLTVFLSSIYIVLKIVLFFILAFVLFSCHKESFTSNADAPLIPTVDTLRFDTVFTTTGSITQSFKILNNNSDGIHISSVKLAGGAASPFQINVGGQSGIQINNFDISKNDSAYVFVSVHINPTLVNTPFIVRDSIEITYNGNTSKVQLEAYGQNAHFFRNRVVSSDETWQSGLPYIILGKLTVDALAQLTIEKGCKIYVHADAPIIINGTLQVNGEKWDSTKVVFTGDRLDDPYNGFPASWPGIVFTGSSNNNTIQYGVIKNAYQAIAVQNPSATAHPKLVLKQTEISNAYDVGLLGINSSIQAENVLVSNCGKNVVLTGGNYHFTHCTVASYANSLLQHKDPVLFVSNAFNQNTAVSNLNAVFQNCIFWGEGNTLVTDEAVVANVGGTSFSVLFDHVLWKMKNIPSDAVMKDTINNQLPLFDSINTAKNYYNFRLKENSPALNTGTATQVLIDLDGNPRPVGLPDLGCYEKQ